MKYLADRLRVKVSDVGDVALGAGAVGAGALAAAPQQISNISRGLGEANVTRLAESVIPYMREHNLTLRDVTLDPKDVDAFKRTVDTMRKNDPKLLNRLGRGALRGAALDVLTEGTGALAKSPIARLGLGALSAGMAYGALKD